MEPPNILWICTDSQRWDTLGCMGNPWVRTPCLDALAQSGVLFERAFCQSPLCMPSRGSFLTGRYPSTNRLRQNGQERVPGLRPVTATLAQAGWHCGLIGKLHLANCDRRLSLGPEWWKHPRSEWLVEMEERGEDGYAEFLWDHAPSGENPQSAYTQWLAAQGVEPRAERRPHPDCGQIEIGRPGHLHQTTWCAEESIRFIRGQADSGRPWLLSANIFDPHPGFDPPESCLQRYAGMVDELPLPEFKPAQMDALPRYQREKYESERGHSTRGWSERDLRWVRAAYWAMCDWIDVQVGRVLQALEASGQRERTLVLFTSDHGELLGDHGFTWKGPFLYDASIRVPLIVSWPGRLPGGRRVPGMVELTDLAPTLLEACGMPPDPAMQGRSLWPVLAGAADGAAIRPEAYAEYGNANPDQPPQWLNMIRTDTHKLIAVHSTLEGELYDLRADPHETHNLWGDPGQAALKTHLLQRLAARMAFTADPLPRRVGVY